MNCRDDRDGSCERNQTLPNHQLACTDCIKIERAERGLRARANIIINEAHISSLFVILYHVCPLLSVGRAEKKEKPKVKVFILRIIYVHQRRHYGAATGLPLALEAGAGSKYGRYLIISLRPDAPPHDAATGAKKKEKKEKGTLLRKYEKANC